MIPKKRGRPATGQGQQINVRIHPRELDALDRWIGAQASPRLTRPQAVRVALSEWLTGLGLLKPALDREDLH